MCKQKQELPNFLKSVGTRTILISRRLEQGWFTSRGARCIFELGIQSCQESDGDVSSRVGRERDIRRVCFSSHVSGAGETKTCFSKPEKLHTHTHTHTRARAHIHTQGVRIVFDLFFLFTQKDLGQKILEPVPSTQYQAHPGGYWIHASETKCERGPDFLFSSEKKFCWSLLYLSQEGGLRNHLLVCLKIREQSKILFSSHPNKQECCT